MELAAPAQAGLAADPFLNSEGPFWGAVQALPQGNVLEIGSRARSGISRRNLFPATCNYTGFDILAGENVTVVGDAHALSQTLPRDHFDFVFSVSVWEHLAMPWLVSLELNKVMKLGGLAMINTHQSWPVHEVPWDYFRFSDFAWDALFNAATGFEIVGRGMGMPCVMGPSLLRADSHASRVEWHYGCLASRVIVRKIGASNLSWSVPPDLVSQGCYPH
ncbi:MAG: methyltransferase domain-containing protein [Opitutae bacterium]|nr:methyltransferase domain-containing protein [Opitutae bacterium]